MRLPLCGSVSRATSFDVVATDPCLKAWGTEARMLKDEKVVTWVWKGVCDGCGVTYEGAEPPVAWIEAVGKFVSGSPGTTTYHFCRICREAMGAAIVSVRREREQEDAHPLAEWERELLAQPDIEAPLATDVEPAHRHEWRWSNTRFADGVTRRYCIDCGVLFTDL